MALTQTQKTDAYQFFIIAFGAAPGVEYMNQLNDAYGAGMTTNQIVNVYTTKPQFEAQYPRFLTNEQFADRLINNVVGTSATEDAKTEAKADVVAALNAGLTKGDVVFNIFNNLANKSADDEQWGATAQMFANKVEVAAYVTETLLINTTDLVKLASYVSGVTQDAATVEAAKIGSTAVPSVTASVLTTGMDMLTGTAANEIFTATIFDNQNTLQSGDKVNGGAGVDRLFADLGTSQKFAITPETAGIEEFAVRAQAVAMDTNNNNMADQPTANYANASLVDAQRMVGVNWFESNNSRADVVIEDVRILPSQITKDITIAMVETDPGNVDFGVYFDQYSLRNVSTSTSTLRIELLDTRSVTLGTAPLKDNPYWGVSFKLDGATQTLTSDGIDAAQTYPELLAAVQAAIAANPALNGKVTAALGNTFNRVDTLSGQSVAGTEIVLTSVAGGAISIDATTGFLVKNGTVPNSSGLHTNLSTATTSSTDLVTAKIVLDDVGRGSTGGDLVVGGLSVGDTSTSRGVQRFEIEVRDNSKLQTINSTNNTLREVTIKNGATSSSSFAYETTTKDAGNLTVNGNVGANVFGDDAALPGSAAQHNAYGFSDVRLIDGSAMTGQLAFSAEVTQASITKYLNLADRQDNPSTDNVAFQYNGGANNDTIRVDIDSNVAASDTLSGREDFTFKVDGGAGNDSITLNFTNAETAAWYVDQKMLKNVSVVGGAGNDTIRTLGAGDVNIDAGAGNDVVYTDNTGVLNSTWIVAAANTNLADLQASTTGTNFLYRGTLTVTYSGAQGAAAGGVTAPDAAKNVVGFESTVNVPTGANFGVNQYHINQAIKNAINGDAVLSKLLAAADGPGNTLTIRSLTDGSYVDNDLVITVAGVDLATLSPAEQSIALSAYKAFSANSTATLADAQAAEAASVVAKNGVSGMDVNQVIVNGGAKSLAESDNTINLGAGDDVLVLGTGAFSNDTVVFSGYNLGKKTIVNFVNAGTGVGDGDYLNFSAYLNGKSSASGSVESARTIPTTLNADASVEANSVTVLNGNFTATDTFAGLTAEKLLAAINSTNTGVANYAGINAGTLDALNSYVASGVGTTLVGGTGKAVVLVENNLNRGEYKAFELTFTGTASNTTRDFSGVQEIATIDLGATGVLGAAGGSLTGSASAVAGSVGGVVPPVVPPVGTVVNLSGATAAVTAATAAEIFALDTAAALADAAGTNFQVSLNGLAANDSLRIDLPTANAAITTLAQLDGQQGVSVQADPFTGSTVINFGNDANGGEVATLTLVGVSDAAAVAVEIV